MTRVELWEWTCSNTVPGPGHIFLRRRVALPSLGQATIHFMVLLPLRKILTR